MAIQKGVLKERIFHPPIQWTFLTHWFQSKNLKIRQLSVVHAERIGMWGHSLGGSVTLRSMVVSPDIRAGVIWGGVVGTYQEIFNEWWSKRVGPTFTPSQRERQANRPTRQSFIEKFGEPADSN